MIPRPRRYLFLALVGTTLFAVLAMLVESGSGLVHLDNWLAGRCYQFALERPAVHEFFRTVTDLGWGRPLNAVGALSVLVLLVRREFFRSLVWTAGQLACRLILPFAKGQFERPRPQFADIDGYSFPSGHAFGSAVVYALLGLVLLRVWARSRWRWLWAGLIWTLIPLIALSRIMLGVHYFSDVLAGMALGLGWAFWCAAVADWWDGRRVTASNPGSAPPAPPAPSGTGARTPDAGHAGQ